MACGGPKAGKQCAVGKLRQVGSKPRKVWGPQHFVFLGLIMLEPSIEGSLCDFRNHMLGKGQRTELGKFRRHRDPAGKPHTKLRTGLLVRWDPRPEYGRSSV